MREIVVAIVASGALVVAGVFVYLLARSWRVEATLKATTRASTVSLAGGLSVAGMGASAAAILNGPGVLAVHLGRCELWRRAIGPASIEAALAWIDAQLAKPAGARSRRMRLLVRIKDWLLPRTDLAALPELGLRLLAGLRRPSLRGAITYGFSDPALTGNIAAFLFPLAGVLSPLGVIDVRCDWTGNDVVEADVEVSLGVVPARAIYDLLRFVRRHVHLFGAPPVPSTLET